MSSSPAPDVGAWLRTNSSHARDWNPLTLVRDRQLSVAVVLPALNEERTVGAIVEVIRRDLIDGRLTGGMPLVDDLVVVDSGSSDHTVSVACAAGARVVTRHDVLPEFAPVPGKGEVLWRGLAATSADIVAYVDSDLEDMGSEFVTGLLGPLLTDPDLHLVKATYDRPLRHGETILPAGGGRVTELVARPLLNLFFPQLAGFVQPLSGEYAGRRSLLEQLAFPTGYGVEIGLLIDAWARVGLSGLAQVDLERRKHRNQSDDKLARMATEIIRVVVARLEATGRLAVTGGVGALPTGLLQFQRSIDAGDAVEPIQYVATSTDVPLIERPPLAGLRAPDGDNVQP